jgi:hypothetical protein
MFDRVPSVKKRTATIGSGILAAACALAACGHPVSGSGFLGTYLDMKPNRYLEAESHRPGLRFEARRTLVIQPVRPYLRGAGPPRSVRRLTRAFQEALVDELGRSRLFAKVTANTELMPPADADYALDAAITEIDTGVPDATLKPAGAVAGARRIAVEGRISEIATGALLFKFKDARGGEPKLAGAWSEADAEARLEEDLRGSARAVADTLREIRAGSLKVPASKGREGGAPAPPLKR